MNDIHLISRFDDGMTIRHMLGSDIREGMRLKNAAGWNQTPQDWELYLSLSPKGCFVAEFCGTVVGTVTTVVYEGGVSWIGMMLVDPEYRRKGIATRLMRKAVDQLKGCETVKLDATLLGKKVYENLGFKEEFTLYRLITNSVRLAKKATAVLPVSEDDFSTITEMDKDVFGAGRMAVLKPLMLNNPGMAVKCCRNEVLSGYCMGRPGTRYYQIGPISAISPKDAFGLAEAALSNLPGQAAVIDVPAYQQDFLEWIQSNGFEIQRELIRMYHGSNLSPGLKKKVFAICGPEMG
ncbi:GNAT family N-acetyltransferase [Candidatus Latescibacterota bacterium]